MITNADKIRSMSDEELAEWLTNFCCATVGNAANARLYMYHDSLLDWLRFEQVSWREISLFDQEVLHDHD